MSQLSLTEGNVRRALSRFAIPFLGASLLQFLYGAVDLIVVGQFADQAGIAAVSTGSQVMQAVTNFIIGLSTGGTVLVGQYLGARRGEDVNRAIGTLFSLFALIAVVLAAAFALSTNAIVALMQVPAAAVAPTRQYLFICACGLVFITGYNMVSGVLRGLGDSKRPMYFVLVACIINIVGDLLLVGVFGLGAAGAALATVAAQGVSLALALAVLRRRDFPFDFKRRSFRIQGDKAARILRLGLPVAVQNVLVTLSFLIITAIVNHMDILAQSAAVGLVERITGFIMLFPIAFQSAISAMTAQNMGAGRPDRARQGLKYGILFCLAADIAMFVLVQLVPGLAMRLFTPDAEVIYHGVLYLRTYSIDCILVTFVFTLNGFYSGCGRTGFTLFNSLASTFLVRVPAVFFISLLPGVTLLHIGVAAPAASAVQVLLQLLYFRTGRWNHSVLGEAVLACGESTMKVSKTQISWGNPLQFAVLSQPRRAAQRRIGALLATLGLGRRVEHPRILQAVEPYPGRWTHHLLLTAPEDVDGLLAAWLAEAYRFAREKQRRA
ncbi:MATE family efflux transporter [Flavonifractor plautii]|uniref:MATE family efflux transporter n=1 Tax=Flavonifractor plautii TaxID=292800 RepID=UPI000A696C70|nr:MATE family efflux transporter [Flavonifractor plautii]UQA25032.1 MATE family efflux transporter [Flavonifractor plautii]